MSKLGITRNAKTWDIYNNTVEQITDNFSYKAANPDCTLVLAGPSRLVSLSGDISDSGVGSLLSIGTVQAINISQSKQIQPVPSIGTQRLFYSHGNSMINLSITRLMGSGRNLLRALYHSAVAAGVPVSQMERPPALSDTGAWFFDLNSPLFKIPIGIGILFVNPSKQFLGGIYLENVVIPNWGVNIQAGGVMIMEQVSLMGDTLSPAFADYVMENAAGISKETMDEAMGLIDTVTEDVESENLSSAVVEVAGS